MELQQVAWRWRWILGVVFAVVGVAIEADNSLANWPQWRGPTWNGVGPQADPPVTWSETENLLWKAEVDGSGWSTPIVWGDRIFLHTAIPLDLDLPIPQVIPEGTPNIREHPAVSPTWKAQRIEILCLDRMTGEHLWRRAVFEGMPHQGHHRKGGFASQSPVTDGKYLYSYFGSFGLFCYDFGGNIIWKRSFEPQAMEDSLGEGSSPALHRNRLIIQVDTERQSFVQAIDAFNGAELWRTKRDEVSNWSTPRIYQHQGHDRILLNGETVRAYDFVTGKQLWECAGQNASALPMPAVGQGMAFTASGWRQDVVLAITLGQRGDLTGTDYVVWKLDRGAPYVPCPMLWGNELYLLEDQSFFSCVNAADGARHYFKHRLPGGLNFSASPVGAKDRLYLLSESGETVVLRRGPVIEVLSINRLEGTFYASPALVGREIYLRSDRFLYAFGERATKGTTTPQEP